MKIERRSRAGIFFFFRFVFEKREIRLNANCEVGLKTLKCFPLKRTKNSEEHERIVYLRSNTHLLEAMLSNGIIIIFFFFLKIDGIADNYFNTFRQTR